MPKADFVFLDEIWKSSPAILNTLLTIVNEKVYRNGTQEEKVPLKALIAASNETPPKGQGLEAMYDRFIMRLLVNPVESVDNFKSLIIDKDVNFDAALNEKEKISTEDWKKLQSDIEKVKVPDNVLNIILNIKNEIEEYNKGNNESIYVSDRRWKNIVYILKSAAYFSGRDEIMPIDCSLIYNCVWTLEENINEVKSIVEKSIKNFSQISREYFEELSKEIDILKKDISSEQTEDKYVYDTVNIGGSEYIPININYYLDNISSINNSFPNTTKMASTISFLNALSNAAATVAAATNKINHNLYVPINKFNSPKDFYALDQNGNADKNFKINLVGTDNLIIRINSSAGNIKLINENNEIVQ